LFRLPKIIGLVAGGVGSVVIQLYAVKPYINQGYRLGCVTATY